MELSMKQLMEMTPKERETVLREQQGQLRQMRFLDGQNELKQVHKVREIRKNIARILTVASLKAKEEPLTKPDKQA